MRERKKKPSMQRITFDIMNNVSTTEATMG